jgi:hypothetical protein
VLLTRKPRRYQKGRYRIDWDNGISRDLLVSLPLVRGSEFASIGKNGVIGTPSAATTATTPKGTALKLDGTGYIALGTACLLPSASTPFTLALYELPDATSAFSSLVGLSGGSYQWLWIRGTNAAYYCAVSSSNYGAVQNFNSVGAQVAGVGHRFLLTSPGGVAGISGYRLWMDGVEQTSSGTTYGAAVSSTNYIGWDGYDTKFNGKLRDFNLWGRILSDAEIEAYFERPDQIYRGRYIPFPESAGGGAATDLTIQDATHAHGADNLALTLDTFLTIAEATHAHTADNITLTTGGANLAVDEALHTHAADNLALTLDTFLTVQDAAHGHAADNLVLTLDVFLAIADAMHAQAADNITLTIGGVDLIISEALHAHAADNLAFTLDTFLAVADALHAQTADNLTLSLGGALSDAEFRQMYDWLQDLYGRQLLTVGTFLALK